MKKRTVALILCVLMALASPGAFALQAPGGAAYSAILIHGETGAALYEKNADEQMLVASTTKVMTALVALEYADPDEMVTVKAEDTLVEGSSMYLKAGQEYLLKDLLYGLMLVSGNDAALALASHVGGDVDRFVQLMNKKALELGLSNTSFANPHGLDDENHYSTARDLAVIFNAAMEDPVFQEVVATKAHNVGELTYVNHNKLLWKYQGMLGGKTGYTMAAGRSLITCAERDGIRYICVTLNDPDDWRDHCAMYDWAFENYQYDNEVPPGEYMKIPVISGSKDSVGVAPAGDLKILRPKNTEAELVVELPRFVFADVKAGQPAGSITVLLEGQTVGQIQLCYTESVLRGAGIKLTPWERIRKIWLNSNNFRPVSSVSCGGVDYKVLA